MRKGTLERVKALEGEQATIFCNSENGYPKVAHCKRASVVTVGPYGGREDVIQIGYMAPRARIGRWVVIYPDEDCAIWAGLVEVSFDMGCSQPPFSPSFLAGALESTQAKPIYLQQKPV